LFRPLKKLRPKINKIIVNKGEVDNFLSRKIPRNKNPIKGMTIKKPNCKAKERR